MISQRYINPKMTVAIDGWESSGKGSLAKSLAEHFRLKYLDTGALYRSVAYLLLKNKFAPDDVENAVRLIDEWDFDFRHVGDNKFGTFLNGENVSGIIRTAEVGRNSSVIAVHQLVRDALLDTQVEYARLWEGRVGVVMDGRDIGWRVCPHAHVKFFMDADPETRAQRRHSELISKGETLSFEHVLDDLNRRDERDADNTKPADDAIVIDSTNMDIKEVFEKAVQHINSVIEAKQIEFKSE